ncbi:MAG TPA: hypothetical protein VGH38_22750 [Bryobacteraceae bacterium]
MTIIAAGPLLLFAQAPAPAKSAPTMSPICQELLDSHLAAARRSLALAKAIPQEKLTWRPMEGVRSFGEVLVHMIAARRCSNRTRA